MVKSISATSPILRRAGLVTALSVTIGLVYYVYLTNVSSPYDLMRIVPFAWLISSMTGFILGIQALRAGAARPVGAVLVAVCLLSTLLAAIFSMGALMGD